MPETRQSVHTAKNSVSFTYILLLALFCSLALTQSLRAETYQVLTLAENLDNPWCVASLPDGAMLITERAGKLKRLNNDGSLTEIGGVPPVLFAGQGGLFDVLLDPEFQSNQLVYLSYASGNMKANATQVARARLTDDSLEDMEVIFVATPEKDTPQHYGGKLALLNDGTLLLTTGDGFDYREQAQNRAVTLGKTVRINRDGSLPTDNPFSDGGGHPAVWTYGHRNPQGLAVDSATGAIYLHEHGPKGGDEINVLQPGSNYGWPAATYGDDYSGAKVSPFTSLAGMQDPLKVWVPSIAPSGLTVYRGNQFPEWQGSLFVGALVDQEVRRVTMDEGGLTEEAVFPEIAARIRDIRQSPDGALLILTDGTPGSLYKVTRTGR
jgi:glucose/arabinose dehydrogenase